MIDPSALFIDGSPTQWSSAEVLQVEQQVGFKLHEDYVAFVSSIGSGHIGTRVVPGISGLVDEIYGSDQIIRSREYPSSNWISRQYVSVIGGTGGEVCMDAMGALFWADFDKAEELDVPLDQESLEIIVPLSPNWNGLADRLLGWEIV